MSKTELLSVLAVFGLMITDFLFVTFPAFAQGESADSGTRTGMERGGMTVLIISSA